jgi:hypothetical protein
MLAAIISMAQQASPKVTGQTDMALFISKNQLTGLILTKGGSTRDWALGMPVNTFSAAAT